MHKSVYINEIKKPNIQFLKGEVIMTNLLADIPTATYGEYLLEENGIYTFDMENQMVKIAEPIFIKEVRQNASTSVVEVILAFKYFDEIKEISVQRSDLRFPKIQSLSNYGVDVQTKNAKKVEDFLVEQEKNVQYKHSYENLGWHKYKECYVFAQNQFIDETGLLADTEYAGNTDVIPKGDYHTYLEILQSHVVGHTPLEFILALGFAGTLISLACMEGTKDLMLVHAYGESTTGKTTSAKLLASIFGKPTATPDGLIRTWNTTQKALKTQFGNIHGIPMILDEASVKDAGHDFSKEIYQLSMGVDDARLNKDIKTRQQNTWSGLLFSTAEHDLLSKASANSGLKVRLKEFGNVQWTKSKAHAEELNAQLEKNYGYLVEPFVTFLLKKGTAFNDDMKNAKELLQNATKNLDIITKEIDSLFQRRLNHYAYVILAIDYVNECFDLNLNKNKVLKFILEQEEAQKPTLNRKEAALEYINAKIVENSHQILGEDAVETTHMIIGKKAKNDTAILKNVVDDWLLNKGFNDPQQVMTELKKAGYLSAESGRNTRKRKLIDRDVVVYVFKN